MTQDILQETGLPDYDRTFCRECLQTFHHLGSHVAKAHKMTAREYKSKYGLDYSLSLISDEVLLKKREAFERDREKYLKQGMENIRPYLFKKGHTGQHRTSQQTRKRLIKQSTTAHKPGKCPIGMCPKYGSAFPNLPSHLYSAHRLIQV